MGAVVIVSIKLMPDSPETDLGKMCDQAKKEISEFGGTVGKTEETPVAFGLKSLDIMFSMPEEKGSTEDLEKKLGTLPNVSSVQVLDVRRAVG